MWLVICQANDLAALWAYRGLQALGLRPLELITGDALVCSQRWEHRLTTTETTVNIVLSDGRRINDGNIAGVLNRLGFLPDRHLAVARPQDREYAAQEFTAFFISWLYALRAPILNRPGPAGLCGQWRSDTEWVWLAAQAGLPTTVYHCSSHPPHGGLMVPKELPIDSLPRRTVLVVADEVLGDNAAPPIREGCRCLARLAGTSLLGVDFAVSASGSWLFAGATLLPDLRLGGRRFIEVLAATLQDGREAG